MQAVLLSAGTGSRLKPFTDTWPKCLMPINDIPLLEYWIYDLINLGVEKIYVNTHYCNEEVELFIKNNKYRNQIVIFHEKELLGTAGTIKALKSKLNNDSCMVVHADNFCICSFDQYIKSHLDRPNNTEITMMTFKTKRPESCGIVEINKNGIVTSFTEKSREVKGNIANAAIYILEPSVINWISSHDKIYDISNDVINRFLGKINTWHNKEILIDIGTYESLLSCKRHNHSLKLSEQSLDWINYFKNTKIFKELSMKN